MKNLFRNNKGMILSSVVLFALFAFSAKAQQASFHFFPNTVEAYEGESFETQVLIETGNVPFTVFDLHLAFDSEYLQVMEAEVLQDGMFHYHLPPEFSNDQGKIDMAAFMIDQEITSESIALVNITFVALQATELTQVIHPLEGFPKSVIAYGGENVMSNANNLTVNIVGNALSDGIESGENEYDLTIWPNPSKDYAQVSFELAEEGQVSLQIFSAGGELIDTIYEGGAQGKTRYKFEVDANSLSAGTYTCRLMNTSGKMFSKALTIVK
jgi:hypothetical protein